MARFTTSRPAFIRCLCAILALVCAFCLFWPHLHACHDTECSTGILLLSHLHACHDTECPVYILCSVLKHLWIPTTIISALFPVAILSGNPDYEARGGFSLSLVQLKVKLSD